MSTKPAEPVLAASEEAVLGSKDDVNGEMNDSEEELEMINGGDSCCSYDDVPELVPSSPSDDGRPDNDVLFSEDSNKKLDDKSWDNWEKYLENNCKKVKGALKALTMGPILFDLHLDLTLDLHWRQVLSDWEVTPTSSGVEDKHFILGEVSSQIVSSVMKKTFISGERMVEQLHGMIRKGSDLISDSENLHHFLNTEARVWFYLTAGTICHGKSENRNPERWIAVYEKPLKLLVFTILKFYHTMSTMSQEKLENLFKCVEEKQKIPENFQPQASLKHLTEAIACSPLCGRAYAERGKYYYKKQKYREALDDFHRCIFLSKKDTCEVLEMLMDCLRRCGSMDRKRLMAARLAHISRPNKDFELFEKMRTFLGPVLLEVDREEVKNKPNDKEDVKDKPNDKEDVKDKQNAKAKQQQQQAEDREEQVYHKYQEAAYHGSLLLVEALSGNSKALAGVVQDRLSEASSLLQQHPALVTKVGQEEKRLLHFACAMAKIHSQDLKLVQAGLEMMRGLEDTELRTLALWGSALALSFLSRFTEALTPAEECLSLVQNVLHRELHQSLTWPQSSHPIPQCDPTRLQNDIQDLISRCRFPPPPDAICRAFHQDSEAPRQAIYRTDLDFSGYVKIHCYNSCTIDFHRGCWSLYKQSSSHRMKGDKDALGSTCPTDGCEGKIICIITVTADGNMKTRATNEFAEEAKAMQKRKKLSSTSQEQAQNTKETPRDKQETVKDRQETPESESAAKVKAKASRPATAVPTETPDTTDHEKLARAPVSVLKKDEDDEDKYRVRSAKLGKSKKKEKKEEKKTWFRQDSIINFTYDNSDKTLVGAEDAALEEYAASAAPLTPVDRRPPRMQKSWTSVAGNKPLPPKFAAPDPANFDMGLEDFGEVRPPGPDLESFTDISSVEQSLALEDPVGESIYGLLKEMLEVQGPRSLEDPEMVVVVDAIEQSDELNKLRNELGSLPAFLERCFPGMAVIDGVLCLAHQAVEARELANSLRQKSTSDACQPSPASSTTSASSKSSTSSVPLSRAATGSVVSKPVVSSPAALSPVVSSPAQVPDFVPLVPPMAASAKEMRKPGLPLAGGLNPKAAEFKPTLPGSVSPASGSGGSGGWKSTGDELETFPEVPMNDSVFSPPVCSGGWGSNSLGREDLSLSRSNPSPSLSCRTGDGDGRSVRSGGLEGSIRDLSVRSSHTPSQGDTCSITDIDDVEEALDEELAGRSSYSRKPEPQDSLSAQAFSKNNELRHPSFSSSLPFSTSTPTAPASLSSPHPTSMSVGVKAPPPLRPPLAGGSVVAPGDRQPALRAPQNFPFRMAPEGPTLGASRAPLYAAAPELSAGFSPLQTPSWRPMMAVPGADVGTVRLTGVLPGYPEVQSDSFYTKASPSFSTAPSPFASSLGLSGVVGTSRVSAGATPYEGLTSTHSTWSTLEDGDHGQGGFPRPYSTFPASKRDSGVQTNAVHCLDQDVNTDLDRPGLRRMEESLESLRLENTQLKESLSERTVSLNTAQLRVSQIETELLQLRPELSRAQTLSTQLASQNNQLQTQLLSVQARQSIDAKHIEELQQALSVKEGQLRECQVQLIKQQMDKGLSQLKPMLMNQKGHYNYLSAGVQSGQIPDGEKAIVHHQIQAYTQSVPALENKIKEVETAYQQQMELVMQGRSLSELPPVDCSVPQIAQMAAPAGMAPGHFHQYPLQPPLQPPQGSTPAPSSTPSLAPLQPPLASGPRPLSSLRPLQPPLSSSGGATTPSATIAPQSQGPLLGSGERNPLQAPLSKPLQTPAPLPRPLDPPSLGAQPRPLPSALGNPLGAPGGADGKVRKSRPAFDNIMGQLLQRFPHCSKSDFTQVLNTVRERRGGTLSGATVEQLVEEASQQLQENLNSKQQRSAVPPGLRMGSGVADLDDFGDEEMCSICHEDLIHDVVAVDCMHRFHNKCIRQWLETDKTCPNCRNYTLLPDDFPALG